MGKILMRSLTTNPTKTRMTFWLREYHPELNEAYRYGHTIHEWFLNIKKTKKKIIVTLVYGFLPTQNSRVYARYEKRI